MPGLLSMYVLQLLPEFGFSLVKQSKMNKQYDINDGIWNFDVVVVF
jgi:hypothetical protein